MFVEHKHSFECGNSTNVDLCVKNNDLTVLLSKFAGEDLDRFSAESLLSCLYNVLLHGSHISSKLNLPIKMSTTDISAKTEALLDLVRAISMFSLIWKKSDDEFRILRPGQLIDVGVLRFSLLHNLKPYSPELYIVLGSQREDCVELNFRSINNWPWGAYVFKTKGSEEMANMFHIDQPEFKVLSNDRITEYKFVPEESNEDDLDIPLNSVELHGKVPVVFLLFRTSFVEFRFHDNAGTARYPGCYCKFR
jgi:hypothetical protein